MEEFIQSANINEKWLNNIYDNIKNLEDYERLIREGCKTLLDYVNIPIKNRPIIIPITQFKNLKFFVTEFKLLLADLTPILKEDKAKAFEGALKKIDKSLRTENLFLIYRSDTNNNLVEVIAKELLFETIEALHSLKVDLFKQIKNILYINSNE